MSSIRFENPGKRVVVEIDGQAVADSTDVVHLHEGNLPVRYYFPKTDVRFDLLTPTETSTRCHWKGDARYWSADVGGRVHEDVLWGYEDPLPKAAEIAGRVSFYNDRVTIRAD
jgi:uncharacterized protein (DUF427 family)